MIKLTEIYYFGLFIGAVSFEQTFNVTF